MLIEQKVSHKDYVDHLFIVFRNWVSTPPKRREVVTPKFRSENYRFKTIRSESFRVFGELFYKDRKKILPELLNNWLTERSVAYWFMDDGSIKSKDSKGVIFNTHSFTESEVKILCEILNTKFGLETKPRSQKDGFQIYVSGKSYEKFMHLVGNFILPSMRYKLPPPRKKQDKHICPKSNGGAQW